MITTTIRTAEDGVQLVERVAANRGHHVLLTGPAGAGKTMIARRIAAALPPFEDGDREHVEHSWLWQGSGLGPVLDHAQLYRPFRAPHHTCSSVALSGGGCRIRPGEVSLAHGGVLFLDDAPEFRRHALESLAGFIARDAVTVRRVVMPAKLWALVAAANYCPCGRSGRQSRCACSADTVERFRARIDSSPLAPLFAERVNLQWTTGPTGEAARFSTLLPL